MNPLTQVKNTQKITAREIAAGISENGSWHAKYKDSAYVYVGGLPYTLTEGDLIAIFAQYGEVVDVNLVRDKGTGKSKGFAFLAYEDQRSTVLAVDNLNGANVVGRTIKVDHVANYKRKEEEDEEEQQQKREERGVCYAFQRGECQRGSACKFSHDEKRNANTGWGSKDDGPRWGHDKYNGGNFNDPERKERNDSRRDVNRKWKDGDKVENEYKSRSARRDDGERYKDDKRYNKNYGDDEKLQDESKDRDRKRNDRGKYFDELQNEGIESGRSRRAGDERHFNRSHNHESNDDWLSQRVKDKRIRDRTDKDHNKREDDERREFKSQRR